MKISHAWLQEYFKDTLPTAEVLADLFTFHSFEIEGIEDVSGDRVIDAKILPDRAHFCLSYRGIAEEVSVLTGLQRVSNVVDNPFEIDNSLSKAGVSIEDELFCRRYVSRRISNIKVKESPDWVKLKLAAMDGRSINTIVDVGNLTMFEYGQPLHAFDADKVVGNLVVRRSTEGERIVLLDGKEITLTSGDFVIADSVGPLAIAGVKGGKRAEVTNLTKNIIIESANFHPATVRKTATKYNLRNESSKRFENEITPEIALDALNHVSNLIKKLSPDATFGPISDIYQRPVSKGVFDIKISFINQKLGIEIPKEEILKILNNLSIEVVEKDDVLFLTIPYHRLDLVVREDVIEEVGRIYGYNKIIGTKLSPQTSESSQPHPFFCVSEKIKNILSNKGFSEVYLYALVNNGEREVAYPLASDKKALRSNLSDGMSKALEANARSADLLFLDTIKMFEIGKVFGKDTEHTSLCVGIKRIRKVKGQTANEDIRKIREELIAELGTNIITACTIDDTGGLMILKGKQIGTINAIDGVMELNLDALVAEVENRGEVPSYESLVFGHVPKVSYKPFSLYPFMVRDIAVFVPETVKPEEIESIITLLGTNLLIKHGLFDRFQKDSKISYAFRLIFQSFERTLTDEDVNPIMALIVTKMTEKGWEVR